MGKEYNVGRFTFFPSYYENIKQLSNEESGILIKAMCAYMFDGVVPTFDNPVLNMAWINIQWHLDKSLKLSSNGKKAQK